MPLFLRAFSANCEYGTIRDSWQHTAPVNPGNVLDIQGRPVAKNGSGTFEKCQCRWCYRLTVRRDTMDRYADEHFLYRGGRTRQRPMGATDHAITKR